MHVRKSSREVLIIHHGFCFLFPRNNCYITETSAFQWQDIKFWYTWKSSGKKRQLHIQILRPCVHASTQCAYWTIQHLQIEITFFIVCFSLSNMQNLFRGTGHSQNTALFTWETNHHCLKTAVLSEIMRLTGLEKKLTKPLFGVVQPSLAFAGCVWLHL